MMKPFKILTLALLCYLPSLGFTFSDLGHKTVAAMAWPQLSPSARQQVQAILGTGKHKFVKASVWADHIKGNKRFDYLKPLHYVNMPKRARIYQKQRDCKNGKCVVQAIHDFSHMLKSGSDSEQKLALRMLIHLIGDVHQPLHAGLYEDRGGNRYDVRYNKRSVSLHKFWDHKLLQRIDKRWQRLAQRISQREYAPHSLGSPESWAQESHHLVVTELYGVKENQALTAEYLANAEIIISEQLHKAAWRLAMWLNKMW